MKSLLAAAAIASAALITPTASIAQDSREFAVVGTWGQLAHWKERESVFWNETLPGVTDGRLTANAKPLTELGLDGNKVMREVRAGAFDFAHGVFLYIAGDSPVIEGSDLSGLAPDLDTFRAALDVYKPIMQAEFDEKYDSRILMLYAWPQSHFYCNFPEDTPSEIGLDVFEGLKIRSYGASLGDLISTSLNAVPVSVSFGETLSGLQKGLVDCGVTSELSAHSAKWYQAATHVVPVSLGYTASFLAVNNDVWASLSADDQTAIEAAVKEMEEEMFAATARDDEHGLACNTDGPCTSGENGNLIPVTLTADAQAELRASLATGVLANWAERCEPRSEGCVANWNSTIGKVLGYEIK